MCVLCVDLKNIQTFGQILKEIDLSFIKVIAEIFTTKQQVYMWNEQKTDTASKCYSYTIIIQTRDTYLDIN